MKRSKKKYFEIAIPAFLNIGYLIEFSESLNIGFIFNC